MLRKRKRKNYLETIQPATKKWKDTTGNARNKKTKAEYFKELRDKIYSKAKELKVSP